MNIMNKLSLKSLRMNRKRTISTVIGITLSTALICAVASLVASVQATLVENAINERGYWHLKIDHVSQEDIGVLENNRDIRDAYQVADIGYSFLAGSQNVDKPYTHLYSMDKSAFEQLRFSLVEGRFPENENELLITRHMETNGKVTLQVGDSITLDVGERVTTDGYSLEPSNLYRGDEEVIRDRSSHSFRIVGIIERPYYEFEPRTDPGYTSITTGLGGGSTDMYLALKKPRQSIPEVLGVEDYSQVKAWWGDDFKYEDWQINSELMRWEAFAFSDSTVAMLYAVVGVVLSIILITSVFCIRNSFAISTTEKMRMYGMLSSVGATRRQLRKSVLFEGAVLGCVGIPLGIVSGFFAVFVLLKIVNSLLGDFLLAHVDGIVYRISLLPVILSVVLGTVTIYFSAISSAKKAARVSPIEQLRNAGGIRVKEPFGPAEDGSRVQRKSVGEALVGRLFGMGGILAYKNLKRSRQRYRTTVVSIAVSVFVFISMSAFIAETFDFSGMYYNDYAYNVSVYPGEDFLQGETEDVLSLENVDESFLLYQSRGYIKIRDMDRVLEKEAVPPDEDYDIVVDENGETDVIYKGGEVVLLSPVALDSESFRKYCGKIGVDYEKARDGGILFDTFIYSDPGDNRQIRTRRYTYRENEMITGGFLANGEAETEEAEVSIRVAAVTDEPPFGLEGNYYNDGGYLILESGSQSDMVFYLSKILLQSDNAKRLTEKLEELKLDIRVYDLDKDVREERAMLLVIKIFLYGFIAVITLIGVTNIFNVISANMELRQKEFAMLKSVGMTSAEFRRMINLETLFLGSKSLVYGILAGLAGTCAMYAAFSVNIVGKPYIPLRPILLSMVFVFLLIFLIMRYSMGKINRQNTIETIRRDVV